MRMFCLLLAALFLAGCAASPDITDPTQPTPETRAPAPQPTEIPETSAPPEMHPMEILLRSMSLEQQVGQLFLAQRPQSDALAAIGEYHLGGFLLFAHDIEGHTAQTLSQMLEEYRRASEIPMLIAVDEEGGTVCRVSRNPALRPECFAAPRQLFESGGMEAVLNAEEEKALLLSSLGINVNLGPVCDITTDPGAFMYSRSLGQDPQTTGAFAMVTSSIMLRQGVGTALKHFPGYGNNADTHTGIARDSRSLQELQQRDLVPFSLGIQGGCGAIMVSHTVVEALDEAYPASLSREVHRYLREDMGFEGVILTDDLSMGAIVEQYGPEEAAVLAVLAGNDLLCCSNYPVQYKAVLEAVESGRIPRQTLENAVLRVLKWKYEIGLLS